MVDDAQLLANVLAGLDEYPLKIGKYADLMAMEVNLRNDLIRRAFQLGGTERAIAKAAKLSAKRVHDIKVRLKRKGEL